MNDRQALNSDGAPDGGSEIVFLSTELDDRSSISSPHAEPFQNCLNTQHWIMLLKTVVSSLLQAQNGILTFILVHNALLTH